jgi:cytochrome bd-type quinol oxidase subunit 2
MKSFSLFNMYDWAVVAALILITIVLTLYFIKKSPKETDQNTLKASRLKIILGILAIILSVVWFIHIETSINKTMIIMQTISIMTSEPVVMMSIALFLSGILLTLEGIYRCHVCK